MESNAYLDSLDDPISIFDRDIRHIIKSPSTSNDPDSELLSVLQRCIQYIQKQERYLNDPRYLRIWLMYAAYYPDPLHVFSYLERAEIGKYLSAFYNNYSSLLEQNGSISDAINVLRTGIDMHAQPLSRLLNRMEILQKKCSRSSPICIEKLQWQPDHQQLPDTSIYLKLPHDHKKYKFPVALEIHDNAAKRCQLIIEAKLFDIQVQNRRTDNGTPLETTKSAKRRRTKYAKTILNDEQQLSFEEVRVNDTYDLSKWTSVKRFSHKNYGERDSAKSSYTTTTNKNYHHTRVTPSKSEPVQLCRITNINDSSGISEICEPGLNISPQVSCEGSRQSKRSSQIQPCKHPLRASLSVQRQLPRITLNEEANALTASKSNTVGNVLHISPFIPLSAVHLNTCLFDQTVQQLKSNLQMDSDYYDSTNDPIPLKGSLVRLSQNKSSSRFVPFLLQVAPYSLSIIDSLAQGGHARVFIARNMQNMTCAVKIQFPPHAYEYCMLKRIITKLGPSSSKIAVRPISCQHFQNASCLVMEYCSQGTLLAAVNKIKMAIPQATSTATLGVAEPLAMFLTIRLLECVITIHRNGFVHGDIKPDNVMLNFQTLETETSGKYAAIIYAGHDDEYWVLKHIKMIDFGRAIDLNMFPCGQTFIASWDTNPNDDPPQTLRHGEWEPWVLDYWGIAKVIHCLLFGQHMQVVPAGQQWTTRQPLKRWWHTPIWKKTFNVLLNPTQNLPITDLLRNIQNEMKIILIERDCKSNKRLSSMIVELENLLE